MFPYLKSMGPKGWHLLDDFRRIVLSFSAVRSRRANAVLLVMVLLLTLLPSILNLAGADFGQGAGSNPTYSAAQSGVAMNTLLGWTSMMLAIFVAIMAFIQHRINGDPIVPIIGLALLCSGVLDMANVIINERIVISSMDPVACTSLLWLMGRMFNAIIPLAGALILVRWSDRDSRRISNRLLARFTAAFGLILVAITTYGIFGEELGFLRRIVPGDGSRVVARPWELLPIVFYLLAGLIVYPIWHRRRDDHLMMTMGVATIPNIVAQLHMAFGSVVPYDNGWFVAHYLKVLAYALPVVGLCLDYVRTYRAEIEALCEMRTMGQILGDEQMRLKTILQNMGQGVVVTDQYFRVQTINRAAESYLGLTLVGAKGHSVLELLGDEDFAAVWRQTIARGADLYKVRLDVHALETRHLWVTRSSFKRPSGRVGYIMILQDMTREQELDRLKNNFISSVSHELRTPLTSIRGFVSTIRRQSDMPAEQQDNFLQIVETEASRLGELVEDLLAIAQLEEGTLHLEMQLFHLSDVFRQMGDTLKASAEAAGHRLDLDVPGDLPMLLGDTKKIGSVISNLVANAIKYTPEGGRIRIGVEHTGAHVVFQVADTGIGMAREDIPHVFDRFYRSAHVVDKAQGSGLGLAIVKELVTLHGGDITVQSQPDKGSTFTVRLPVPNQASAATLEIANRRMDNGRTTVGAGRRG